MPPTPRWVLARYRSEVEKIAIRQTFASLARTDHLTGLANRLGLDEAFDRAFHAPGAGLLAVHCLDLDRFKPINDDYGHPMGDKLLRLVADRLRSTIRSEDIVARLGGDEFVLLQTRASHVDEVELMARRIVRTLGQPYEIDGYRLVVAASLGYATTTGCGTTLSQLITCADSALYRIKRDGGGAAAPFVKEPDGQLRSMA